MNDSRRRIGPSSLLRPRRELVALLLASTAVTGACSDDASTTSGGTTNDTTTSTSTDATTTSAGGGGASASTTSAGGGGAGGMGGRDFSTDRTKFFGESRCAGSGLQLCEDFESGALDASTWSVVGQTPTIDGAQTARGAKALHISRSGNGASYIKETKTFPAMNNRYFGRAFVYFHAMPKTPDMSYAHWTFIGASGTGVKGEIRVSGQLQGGENLFGVGTDSQDDPNGTGDWTNSDKDPNDMPLAVPQDEWLCIEWMHDGAANETAFYWDATEHASLHTTADSHGGDQSHPYVMPTFTNAWVGWQEYQTSTLPFEMWVDEIAIDPERIGCVM